MGYVGPVFRNSRHLTEGIGYGKDSLAFAPLWRKHEGNPTPISSETPMSKSKSKSKSPAKAAEKAEAKAIEKAATKSSGAAAPKSQIESLFATRLYRADLSAYAPKVDADELAASCYAIAEDDEAGQQWCEENDYPGYTSYASLTDLPWRFPIFKDIVKALDKHIAAFAKDLEFDLGSGKLVLEDIWINILPAGGTHASHIHPHSVISGTTYVAMPEGASALKLEDPRLAMMMAAPTRIKSARRELQPFIYVKPEIGEVLLWESWLRHEVPMNLSEDDRISVSFNYKWV